MKLSKKTKERLFLSVIVNVAILGFAVNAKTTVDYVSKQKRAERYLPKADRPCVDNAMGAAQHHGEELPLERCKLDTHAAH